MLAVGSLGEEVGFRGGAWDWCAVLFVAGVAALSCYCGW